MTPEKRLSTVACCPASRRGGLPGHTGARQLVRYINQVFRGPRSRTASGSGLVSFGTRSSRPAPATPLTRHCPGSREPAGRELYRRSSRAGLPTGFAAGFPQVVGHAASKTGQIRPSPGSWTRRDFIARRRPPHWRRQRRPAADRLRPGGGTPDARRGWSSARKQRIPAAWNARRKKTPATPQPGSPPKPGAGGRRCRVSEGSTILLAGLASQLADSNGRFHRLPGRGSAPVPCRPRAQLRRLP